MKFYRYPLALVAYALLAIYLLAYLWNWLGKAEMDSYWLYFPMGAGAFLLISFVLSLIKLQWEWDVAVQVAFVLAPVLYYVNIKDPYKPPVYVFMVHSGYTGKLNVIFNQDKNAFTNAHNTADTLYFKFDDEGEIVLNESVAYVKESMHNHLFYMHPDGAKVKINNVKRNALPSDTTVAVLVDDTLFVDEGKMQEIHYRLDFPQHFKK